MKRKKIKVKKSNKYMILLFLASLMPRAKFRLKNFLQKSKTSSTYVILSEKSISGGPRARDGAHLRRDNCA